MRACRFHQRMVVQLDCSCRISIFGKVPNGPGDSALWKWISAASGSHLAITIMVTPGESSDMRVTETAAQPVRRLEWHVPPRLNQGDSRGAKDGRVYRH